MPKPDRGEESPSALNHLKSAAFDSIHQVRRFHAGPMAAVSADSGCVQRCRGSSGATRRNCKPCTGWSVKEKAEVFIFAH